MNRLLLVGFTIDLLLAAAPAHAGHGRVTFPEYQRVHAGQYRDHVQHLFGTRGHLVVLWADDHGVRHLTKTYPTDTTDTRVQVTYVGPPSEHPHEGPLLVESKALVTP